MCWPGAARRFAGECVDLSPSLRIFGKNFQLEEQAPAEGSVSVRSFYTIQFILRNYLPFIRCERIEEAYEAFKSVHAFKEDDSEPSMQLEFGVLHAQIQGEKEMATGYRDLLIQPTLRKRCLVGFLTCFAAQGTATMVISNYGPMLYASLGYNTIQQLCLSAGWITICPFGNLFNALVVDKIGRVPMLIVGFVGTTLCLAGECITVAIFNKNGDPKVAAAAVFFLFFHLVCFSSTIDATSYIYSAEIFPTPVRAKGLGISVSGLFVATIRFLSGAPKAFETIGWKYYIVFMVVTTIMIFVAYFFFPETKGVPLEEMAAIFGDEIKYETSDVQKKDEVVLRAIHDEFSQESTHAE
ncbi:hypothetical protein FVER53590_09973 [Fusarium verticillioides]|nr:hypothetical protein FVER53590_09973 [Fusarium verticillioides]